MGRAYCTTPRCNAPCVLHTASLCSVPTSPVVCTSGTAVLFRTVCTLLCNQGITAARASAAYHHQATPVELRRYCTGCGSLYRRTRTLVTKPLSSIESWEADVKILRALPRPARLNSHPPPKWIPPPAPPVRIRESSSGRRCTKRVV